MASPGFAGSGSGPDGSSPFRGLAQPLAGSRSDVPAGITPSGPDASAPIGRCALPLAQPNLAPLRGVSAQSFVLRCGLVSVKDVLNAP